MASPFIWLQHALPHAFHVVITMTLDQEAPDPAMVHAAMDPVLAERAEHEADDQSGYDKACLKHGVRLSVREVETIC